jgi:hypothetical protein
VTFESGCRLSILEESTFEFCSSLSEICIPASVQTIAKQCFCRCRSLSKVAFESGSKIATLGDAAFEFCPSLQSIALPPSIKTISISCFRNCPNFRA